MTLKKSGKDELEIRIEAFTQLASSGKSRLSWLPLAEPELSDKKAQKDPLKWKYSDHRQEPGLGQRLHQDI